MIVEEDVSALDVLALENGLEPNGVGLQLLGRVEVVVSLMAMLVAPPLFKCAAMQSEIEERSCGQWQERGGVAPIASQRAGRLHERDPA